MSTNADYAQYLRRYRLQIIQKKSASVTFITTIKETKKEVTEEAAEKAATKQVTTQTGQCTGGTVNVRKGPGTNYKSYGYKHKGDKLTIYKKQSGWYQIAYARGTDGKAWMSGKYVKVTGKSTSTAAKKATSTVKETVTQTTREDTITVTDKATIDVSNLRCSFVCEKSVSETPNYSQIVIYNLAQDTIASIKAGDTVILEAGYENGNFGMIFTGQIVQPYTSKEDGTDIALWLIVQDGDVYLKSSFVMQTVAKSSTHADIVRLCMGEEVAEGVLTSQLSEGQLPRGKVIFAEPSKVLSQIANSHQSQFYLEDGRINIVAATDYASNEAVELNPATGLIGMPSQTDDGISGQCLMNPSIKLNTLIYINQSLVTQKQVAEGETAVQPVNADGVYRIIKLTYEGDTHGDAWYCNFEAVTQSGAKPSGLTNDGTNPWR